MAASVSSSKGSTASSRLPVLAKYEVLEEIGHGGMATVYRARDPRLGREVAVKIIHPHLRDSTEVAARFVTEAQAVAKLRHPNIVEVFDVSDEEDRERYLVVELLRGQTLRGLLKDRGVFPPEIAAAVAIELLDALAHAHREGIVHRDVKPENVLVEIGEGEGDGAIKVKLTDFGIAKLLDEKGVTSTGQVLGSPAHMAPEQIEGGAIDARSDVFGLGVLLYECMVGHLPFEGNNPAQVLRRVLDGQYPSAELERPVVGKKFSVIVDQSLAHVAADRYPSAQAMKDALMAELKRLGVAEPKHELAMFLRDAEGYLGPHEKRTVEKLCALGAAARKEQRAIDAAADYNRALAYAPTDPTLMKIVGGMHRAEARARTIKRVAPMAAGAVVACLLAFGIAKYVRGRPVDPVADPNASSSAGAIVSATPSTGPSSVASVPSAIASTPPTSTTANTSATSVRTIAIPSVTASAPNVAVTRNVVFKTVRPSNGVTVIVDDDGVERPIEPESTIAIDGAQHTLHFQCVKNVCETSSQVIPAGKVDQPISIELKIKPATLLVQGTGSTYKVRELPISIKPGEIVTIPVNGASGNWITVYDLANPDAEKKVNLSAGQQATVQF